MGEDAACGTIDEGEALPEAAAEPAGEEAGAGEQQRPRDAQAAGSFGPFVQLEFKPRPSEAERAAAEAAAAAAAAAEAEAEADAEAEAAAAAAAAPSIPAVAPPQLLARFRVNKNDSMAVFMAATAEDFTDVVGLLPANSALPASDRMSYLLGRLEVRSGEERGGLWPGCCRPTARCLPVIGCATCWGTWRCGGDAVKWGADGKGGALAGRAVRRLRPVLPWRRRPQGRAQSCRRCSSVSSPQCALHLSANRPSWHASPALNSKP